MQITIETLWGEGGFKSLSQQ